MRAMAIARFARACCVAPIVFVLIGAAGLLDTANAQVGAPIENRWTPIGPEGGTVLSLARDPLDDRHIVVGTYFGGLYESVDGGFNWKPLSSQFSHVPIFALAFDPSRPGTIYAGTFENGLFKTVDGGDTWAVSNEGLTGRNVSSLAVDPFNPSRIMAATTDRGAFLSESGGTLWRAIATDPPILAKTIAFDPEQPDVVYLGTIGNGILRSTDGGTTWEGFNKGLTAQSVLGLTFEAVHKRRLYAATDDGVFEHTAGTTGWVAMSAGLPDAEVTQIVSHPAVADLLYAVTPVGLYFTFGPAASFGGWGFAASISGRLMTIERGGLITHVAATHGGLLATIDFGATWINSSYGMQNVFVGALSAVPNSGAVKLYAGTDGVRFTTDGVGWQAGSLGAGVFEIQPHPRDPNTLFAGLERDGVWKTGDGGRTWSATAKGLLPTQVYALAQSSAWPHPLYAGTSSGLFMSWNSGDTWSAVPTGNIPIVLSIAPDPVRPVTFFGYAAGQIYKTIDEGRSVLPVSTGLPSENIIALKSVAWDKVYAITSGGELYATADDGLNWVRWRHGVTDPALSIDVHPEFPWVVYLGTAGGGVYKSESGGLDWAPRNNGLAMPFIISLAIDPVDGDTVYAGSIGKVYKSVDGAAHWTESGTGLPPAAVTSLVVDVADPRVVYASVQDHGVFKTLDGGDVWSSINPGLPGGGPAPVAIDRFDHTRLFTGTRHHGVYRSADGGASWTPRTEGISLFVRAVAIDPVNPETMFAGSLGGGIFKTTDGARSWSYVGLQDQNVFKLAIDAQNPSRIYAATAQGLSLSLDGGSTWKPAGQKTAYVNSLAVDPANRHTVYAGADNGQVWRSADGGATWEPRPGLPGDNVRALAVDGARRIVYASVGTRGFFRSLDAGLTWWRLADSRIDASVVNALAIDPVAGTIYAATGEGGVLRSTTWGESWAPLNSGLSSFRISHVTIDPRDRGVLYTSTFDQGVFKSIDGGQRWHWIGYGLSTGVTFFVTPDPHEPQTVYAATDAGLFRSEDGGSRWQARGLDGVAVARVEIDPENAAVLYVATKGLGFFRSSDGGATWSASNGGLSTLDIRTLGTGGAGLVYAGTIGGGVARSINGGASWEGGTTSWAASPAMLTVVADPQISGTVYAGTGGIGVLKSVNGGSDWTVVNNGLEAQFVLSMAVDPVIPTTVYAGTVNGGVYVTSDGGRSWHPLNDGLFNKVITSLAIDPIDHRIIYAGTEGGGVFARRVVPPASDCSYATSARSLILGAAGGAQQIQITTSSHCNWSVNSLTEWILVSSAGTGQGSATVDVWVASNDGADVRTGFLIFAGQQIVVSQTAISQSHLLSITKAGAGRGTVASDPRGIFCAADCSESFQHGTAVELAAYPDAGFAFVRWEGSPACGTGRLTLESTITCIARFEASNDLDADTLPDDWERQTGLDATVADGEDGPDGDPDGDGRTNSAEYAARTHPRGFFTRYFAEGVADGFFTTTFSLLNSQSSVAHLLFTFLKADGDLVTHSVAVPAGASAEIDATDAGRLAPSEFATILESDASVVAERTVLWDHTHFGSSGQSAVEAPSTTWYFADAPAGSGFEHRYLVLNPNPEAALVSFTFRRAAPAAPVVRSYTISGRQRGTIIVGRDDPELADASAWTTVTADVPVVLERSVYLSHATAEFVAGHTIAGAAAAKTEWILAYGLTGAFESFAFLANPNDTVSHVAVTFLLPSGAKVDRSFAIPAQQRLAINLEQQDQSLADSSVSTLVRTTNGVPIVAEIATWWPGQAVTWYGATASTGLSVSGTKWGIAGGEIGGPDLVRASLMVANMSMVGGSIDVALLFDDGGRVSRVFELAPSRVLEIDLVSAFPEATWRRFGAVVESVGDNPVPIAVEHAVYRNTNGRPWDAGSRVTGTRLEP